MEDLKQLFSELIRFETELYDLPAHLDWIPAGHCFLLAERRRIPETRLRQTRVRSPSPWNPGRLTPAIRHRAGGRP
jgi:hypothetical protein